MFLYVGRLGLLGQRRQGAADQPRTSPLAGSRLRGRQHAGVQDNKHGRSWAPEQEKDLRRQAARLVGGVVRHPLAARGGSTLRRVGEGLDPRRGVIFWPIKTSFRRSKAKPAPPPGEFKIWTGPAILAAPTAHRWLGLQHVGTGRSQRLGSLSADARPELCSATNPPGSVKNNLISEPRHCPRAFFSLAARLSPLQRC